MPYPFISDKHKKPSLVSPESLMSYVGGIGASLPSYAILCFADGIAQSFKTHESFLDTVPFHKTGMNIDLYRSPNPLKEVRGAKSASVCVVSRFGIGAPASVVCLEKLRALKVKKIISLGLAGALNPDLKTGTKVLLQKAFRDEGCSYHYKAPSDYVIIGDSKTQEKLIQNFGLRPVVSWTTSAPFRETAEEVRYFRSQGVDCVEMEASALMAVGEYYGISVFCLSVVSDHLSPEGWTPQFFDPAVKKSLHELLEQLLFLKNF